MKRYTVQHRTWAFLFAGLALSGLSLLIACGAPAAPLSVPTPLPTGTIETATAPPQATTDPTPVPTYNLQALDATTTALLHTLPTATPNPYAPPGKDEGARANDLYNRAIGTALTLYPPPLTFPPDWITPAPDPLTPWPSIVPVRTAGAGELIELEQMVDPPFTHIMYTSNIWHDFIGDHGAVVHAGCEHINCGQGMLLIERLGPSDTILDAPPQIYFTPFRGGGVHVVDAVGERLTLLDSIGTTLYFDVASRQWVSFGLAQTGTPTPVTSPTPISLAPPTLRAAGAGWLFEYGTSDLPPGSGIIANQWYTPLFPTPVPAGQIRAYAGADAHNQSRGLLIVGVYNPDRNARIDSYQTPGQTGMIRIIDAVGERLMVQSSNGTRYDFDIPSRQWVVPTPEPSPSPGQSPLPSPSAGPSATP